MFYGTISSLDCQCSTILNLIPPPMMYIDDETPHIPLRCFVNTCHLPWLHHFQQKDFSIMIHIIFSLLSHNQLGLSNSFKMGMLSSQMKILSYLRSSMEGTEKDIWNSKMQWNCLLKKEWTRLIVGRWGAVDELAHVPCTYTPILTFSIATTTSLALYMLAYTRYHTSRSRITRAVTLSCTWSLSHHICLITHPLACSCSHNHASDSALASTPYCHI